MVSVVKVSRVPAWQRALVILTGTFVAALAVSAFRTDSSGWRRNYERGTYDRPKYSAEEQTITLTSSCRPPACR